MPKSLYGNRYSAKRAAGAAVDAVGVGVEAVEHVQAVDRAAPAAEVVAGAVGVTEHLAGLELQPLEVAVAPVRVAGDDRVVVVGGVLEGEAAGPAVARVPHGVHVVGVARVGAAQRGLLEVSLPGVHAAPVERGRDALGGHHVPEADRGVLRALPLVDGLLDADVGRADRELAEAAAARGRARRRSSPSPSKRAGRGGGQAVGVGDLERSGPRRSACRRAGRACRRSRRRSLFSSTVVEDDHLYA